MSTRTVIELNHDYLRNMRMLGDLHDLLQKLGSSEVTGELNRADGKPIVWNGNHAIRVLGQRHHSEPEWQQAPASQADLHKALELLRSLLLERGELPPVDGIRQTVTDAINLLPRCVTYGVASQEKP